MTQPSSDLIASHWTPIPGDAVRSHNPANPAQTVWQGNPVMAHVDAAVAAARAAFGEWSSWDIDRRADVLRRFQAICKRREAEMAELILVETGKPAWDSAGEAKLLSDKVDITLESGPHSGRHRVTPFELSLTATRRARTLFRPHGVMAVIGPFNFPAHLPNGHIVPALLTGNTIVFKPSDKTPAVGQFLASFFLEALQSAGAPAGVFNLVHGAGDIAAALTSHDDIDGVLFTGSWPVGRRIMQANLDNPGRMIALEMGGNNAAIVLPDADLKQAAVEVVRCAFITAGQRCTCTRRVIVHRAIAPRFIPILVECAKALTVGDPRGTNGAPVFLGPVIREEARKAVLDFQAGLLRAGAAALLESRPHHSQTGGHFITPGIIQVSRFSLSTEPTKDAGCDMEVFGPLLRVTITDSLDDAIAQANASRYGLAASIFTADPAAAARFTREAKAGCVNINTGTAGASSRLPFGGLDRSGNHRPAGAFSLDYCAYPVASMVEERGPVAIPAGMRWDDAWLA